MTRWLAIVTMALLAVACGDRPASEVGSHGSIEASGAVRVEQGEYFGGSFIAGTGTLSVRTLDVADGGGRVTPLEPHDQVDLTARIEVEGHTYEVRATQAMIEDPRGRFTTWWGVGHGVEHHGRSGIGTDRIPPVTSRTAGFALGELSIDGEVVARGVPIHFMTLDGAIQGAVELDVGDPETPLPGVPDGHLRVLWDDAEVDAPTGHRDARYLGGTILLLAALAGALWLVSGRRGAR